MDSGDLLEMMERLETMYSHRGDGLPTQYVNPDGPAAAALIRQYQARIERLRRLLVKYADRVPLASNARPDWQQEIDEAFEWVAGNPEDARALLGAAAQHKDG